jgi:hypothetical protein
VGLYDELYLIRTSMIFAAVDMLMFAVLIALNAAEIDSSDHSGSFFLEGGGMD